MRTKTLLAIQQVCAVVLIVAVPTCLLMPLSTPAPVGWYWCWLVVLSGVGLGVSSLYARGRPRPVAAGGSRRGWRLLVLAAVVLLLLLLAAGLLPLLG